MALKVTKRSIKSENTKQLIIESARKLMRQYGYEGTSIQMICQEANVSTGTFYHFFDSKHAVLERVVAEVAEAKSGMTIDFETDSPYKLAEGYCRSSAYLVDYFSAEGIFGVFFLNPNGNKLFFSKEHPTYQYMTTTLRGFQQAGKLRADITVEEMFTELFSCYLGMLYSSYTTGHMDTFRERLETVQKRLISTYMVPGTA